MNDPDVATSRCRGVRRGLVGPRIFTLVGIAILVGLGVWQLERKAWKENLIAAIDERGSAPAARVCRLQALGAPFARTGRIPACAPRGATSSPTGRRISRPIS